MLPPAVGQSVYDLREDEQLALAMQQSLADAEPELAGFARGPELATRRIVPDTGGPPEEVLQGPESPEQEAERPLAPVPSAPSAPSAPSVPSPPAAPYAPAAPATAPGVSFASSRSDAISDPEWAGSAEEAGGGRRSHGSGQAARDPQPCPCPPPSFEAEDLQLLEEVVQRSLDLAKARHFEEAEQCLAVLARDHPEFASSREMLAAQKTVAMCKQFNDS
ncbi:Uncharacterized protein SCF082_LOCUS50972 [Durusdinium trenchii]|uniref:Uncharacterized protein n=1 Tax=Durusdinium trenchii TaxID=1381693 RepID=A0ABP0SBH4_9DINO